MSEERLMVLTMLQEGKITSEEASRLLKALEELEMEEELEIEDELYNQNKFIADNSIDEEKQENLGNEGTATKFDKSSKSQQWKS